MNFRCIFVVVLGASVVSADRLFAIGGNIYREAKQPSIIDSYGGEYTTEHFRYISQPIIPATPGPGDVVKYSDTRYEKHHWFGNKVESCNCPGHGIPCHCN